MFSHVAEASHANYSSINSKQTKSFYCCWNISLPVCQRNFPWKDVIDTQVCWRGSVKAQFYHWCSTWNGKRKSNATKILMKKVAAYKMVNLSKIGQTECGALGGATTNPSQGTRWDHRLWGTARHSGGQSWNEWNVTSKVAIFWHSNQSYLASIVYIIYYILYLL